MTNAEILASSINQWMSPIVEGAIQNAAGQDMISLAVSTLITPQRLMQAVKDHLSVPMMLEYVSKLPDNLIPAFSLDVIDGMIEKRVAEGPLKVPIINANLSPDAFRSLKNICQENFESYKTA